MIRRRRDDCFIHRPALVDFVERHALGPESPAALDHLARCARCELDLTEVAQTVFALRRLGERAAEVEAPVDGWTTLRERLERSQRAADDVARRFRQAFGGAIVAIAVAALVAIPSLTATVRPGLDDGLAGVPGARPATVPDARRYDPYGQRLTEGIILAIAGSRPTRVSLVELVVDGPTSTDRHDDPPVIATVDTPTELTAPRTAYRT